MAVVPGPAPERVEPPGLVAVHRLEPDLVERDRHLDLVALFRDPPGGVPDRVPRRVVVAAEIVVDGVRLNAEGIAHQLVRPAFVVERVERHPDPVVVPGLIAVGQPRPDPRRIGIERAESHVQVAVVVGQQADGSNRRRDVLAGTDLVAQLEGEGGIPGGFVERAVDPDVRRRAGDPVDLARLLGHVRGQGHLVAGRGDGQDGQDDQHPEHAFLGGATATDRRHRRGSCHGYDRDGARVASRYEIRTPPGLPTRTRRSAAAPPSRGTSRPPRWSAQGSRRRARS